LTSLRVLILANIKLVTASATLILAPALGSINPLIGCSPIEIAAPL